MNAKNQSKESTKDAPVCRILRVPNAKCAGWKLDLKKKKDKNCKVSLRGILHFYTLFFFVFFSSFNYYVYVYNTYIATTKNRRCLSNIHITQRHTWSEQTTKTNNSGDVSLLIFLCQIKWTSKVKRATGKRDWAIAKKREWERESRLKSNWTIKNKYWLTQHVWQWQYKMYI